MSDALSIIQKLGDTENSLTQREFVSPIYNNRQVVAQINNLSYFFNIPQTEPGWHKFRPLNRKEAVRVGSCELSHIESYLNRLHKIRFVIVKRDGDVFYGVPFKGNGLRLKTNNLHEIYLVYDDMAMDFDEVLCRFDGVNYWYQSVVPTNDMARADYLRESLRTQAKPDSLEYKGLRFEDQTAYSIRFEIEKKIREEQRKLAEQQVKRTKEGRIKSAVEHGGGEFHSFVERGDHFAVTYKVGRETFTSHIAKDQNLKVITAGICLSGEDGKFDLASLIGIIRDAQQRRKVVRTL